MKTPKSIVNQNFIYVVMDDFGRGWSAWSTMEACEDECFRRDEESDILNHHPMAIINKLKEEINRQEK